MKINVTEQDYLVHPWWQNESQWQRKFAWWPVRSTETRQWIWMKPVWLGSYIITGPGDSVYMQFWLTEQEYLIWQLKRSH